MKREFRFFSSEHSKHNYRKLMEISKLSGSSRQIAFSEAAFTSTIFKYTDNEDRICLSVYYLEPKNYRGKSFIKSELGAWVSYNKKTKRYSEKNYNRLIVESSSLDIKNLRGLDWLGSDNKALLYLLSKKGRKNLLLGKYTTPAQVVKSIFSDRGLSWVGHYKEWVKRLTKDNLYILSSLVPNTEISPKLFDSVFGSGVTVYGRQEYVERRDTLNMFYKLGRRVNIKWSEKRWKLEHDNVSKEIMAIKALTIKKESLGYDNPPIHNELKLLENSMEFFEEGEKMGHCVWSSDYFHKAKVRGCYIFKYVNGEVRGTVEVIARVKEDSKLDIYIGQLQGVHNIRLLEHQKHLEYITKELFKPEWKRFFREDLKKKPAPVSSPPQDYLPQVLPF